MGGTMYDDWAVCDHWTMHDDRAVCDHWTMHDDRAGAAVIGRGLNDSPSAMVISSSGNGAEQASRNRVGPVMSGLGLGRGEDGGADQSGYQPETEGVSSGFHDRDSFGFGCFGFGLWGPCSVGEDARVKQSIQSRV